MSQSDLERKLDESMHWTLRRLSYLAPDKPIVHLQNLILLIIEDTAKWEHCTNLLAESPLKELHLLAIRSSKGIVKAWRTYLIEREYQPVRSAPARPPSVTQADDR